MCGFLQSHHGQLPYTPASVSFLDEGLFTTVRRMRTVMRVQLPKYPKAVSIELRGEWRYPFMMMNDCVLRDPDPPSIMLLDGNGRAIHRFFPRHIEEVADILGNELFDVNNYAAQVEKAKKGQERAERMQTRRSKLKDDLRMAVGSVAGQHEVEIRALARALATKLRCTMVRVYHDVDEYAVKDVLGAFEAGLPYGVQAMSK